MTKDITHEIWEHLDEEKDKNKTAEKVYNWLNHDHLGAVICDEINGVPKTFWYEMNSFSVMPNFVYNYLKNFYSKRGMTYLYDLC